MQPKRFSEYTPIPVADGTEIIPILKDGVNATVIASNLPLSNAANAAIAANNAYVLNRSNHTGSQLASTISDFNSVVDARFSGQKGAANGIAPLGSDSKIPASYLPAIVNSFNSRTGNVIPVSGDYPASLIPFTPTATILSGNLQDALSELDAIKLSLTGGTIAGNFNVRTNTPTDLVSIVQNQYAGRAAYFNLIANGGGSPYMSLSGFSGTGTDGTGWNKLWQIGNNNTNGFSLWTNSNGGGGYNTAQVFYADYSQNMNFFGDIKPQTSLAKSLGGTANYWLATYSRKLYLNSTALLDGTVAGVLAITGSLKVSTNVLAGRVLTANAQGLLSLQDLPAPPDATNSTKGAIRLANHIGGTADSPEVNGANFTANGVTWADSIGGKWKITVDTDGNFISQAVGNGGSGNSGQSMGLALALTYA